MIVLTEPVALSQGQTDLLAEYAARGNPVIVTPDSVGPVDGNIRPDWFTEHEKIFSISLDNCSELLSLLRDEIDGGLSQFDTMWTVRVNAYQQPGRIVIHLVNYNRIESDADGPVNESPIVIFNIGVNLRLSDYHKQVTGVTFLSPEPPYREDLTWDQEEMQSQDRLRFQIRSMLVYGIVVIELSE